MIKKWLFDRMMAAIGLLVLWPVLAVVAILIKLKMPGGPVLFVQKRVGKGGKLFDCHKFRTMTVKHDGSTVSVAGDRRITPLGAKLRHYKLDELPGLWDVLIGNMSFVGPRPDVPGYADLLQGDDRDVLKLRPGITGPATLKYRLEDEMLANVRNLISSNTVPEPAEGPCFDKLSNRPSFGRLSNREPFSELRDRGEEGPCFDKLSNRPSFGRLSNREPFSELRDRMDEMSDQELAEWYNDHVIYPDKVRLNCYYYRHYSFAKDIQMIVCTVLGKKMTYAGEVI